MHLLVLLQSRLHPLRLRPLMVLHPAEAGAASSLSQGLGAGRLLLPPLLPLRCLHLSTVRVLHLSIEVAAFVSSVFLLIVLCTS